MEMYNIPENPIYSAEIRKLKNIDPASADQTFNPLVLRIIENAAAIKKETEEKAQLDLSNVSDEIFQSKSVEAGAIRKVASKEELERHVNDNVCHVTAEQTEVYQIAVADLVKHVNDNTIHVDAAKQALWTKAVQTAEQGLTQAILALEKAIKNERRIAELEISLYTNITSNPFSFGFGTLTGIKLVKGVWNKEKQRIEC